MPVPDIFPPGLYTESEMSAQTDSHDFVNPVHYPGNKEGSLASVPAPPNAFVVLRSGEATSPHCL